MDIKVKLSELKDYILGGDRESQNNEKKTSLGIFGGGLHIHFHISINPTFMERKKEGE